MRKRVTYNFAAEEQKINASELDSAVATANLISIMDPKEIDDEEVKLISKATGASEAFVDEMADLCDEACEACNEGHKPEEVKQHFSAAAEELIGKFIESKNFSAPEAEAEKPAEEKVLEIAQLTTLVDDELLKDKPEEVTEVITEATGAPAEAVKDIVDGAKEQFSNGNQYVLTQEMVANFAIPFAAIGEKFTTKAGLAKMEKAAGEKAAKAVSGKFQGAKAVLGEGAKAQKAAFDIVKGEQKAIKAAALDAAKAAKGKKVVAIGALGATGLAGTGYAAGKNFAEEPKAAEVVEVHEETIVPEPTTLVAEGAVKEGVSDTQPVEATAQDPVKAAEIEPKEGGKVQDTTNAEAALKVQNDLATVETAADVTPAETNFGRQNVTGKEVTAGLKSLLGARYIPNK